jgi:hypothetical protein
VAAQHLASLKAGDYAALLAYVEMNARHAGVLQRIRQHPRPRPRRDLRRLRAALPALTGQAYKGGSDKGVPPDHRRRRPRSRRAGAGLHLRRVKAAQARRPRCSSSGAAGSWSIWRRRRGRARMIARLVDEAPLTPAH